MSAVFKKEFRAYFTSPVGYVVLAIMFFFSSFAFFMYNMSYGIVTLANVYNELNTICMMLVLPVLTMRLFSDEKRQKTDQALLTAPVSLTAIALGKFFAALLLFVIGLSITLVFAVIIAVQADPGWLSVIGNFIGLTLIGGMVIAIGMLISTLTESQFIAALGTFAVTFMLTLVSNLGYIFQAVPFMNTVVNFLSVNARWTHFSTGLIRYDDIIFFLSMQALFIFLTVRVLDRKRWN